MFAATCGKGTPKTLQDLNRGTLRRMYNKPPRVNPRRTAGTHARGKNISCGLLSKDDLGGSYTRPFLHPTKAIWPVGQDAGSICLPLTGTRTLTAVRSESPTQPCSFVE